MKKIFVVSLMANIVFLSYLVIDLKTRTDLSMSSHSDEARYSGAHDKDEEEHQPRVFLGSPTSSKNYQDFLNAGLNVSQAKYLVFMSLQEQYVGALESITDRYWEVNPKVGQAIYLQRLLDAQSSIREELISEFGEEARMDPIFSSLFQPLAQQAPYLTADEQLALQRENMERRLVSANRNIDIKPKLEDGTPSSVGSYKDSLPENPINILSEEARKEYNLRHSGLAERLRSSEVKFDEEEFREAFDLVSPSQKLAPYERAMALGELTDLVGSSDAQDIWSKVDPGFDAIATVGSKHELSHQDIQLAYEIINTSYQNILDAQSLRERNPLEAQEAVKSASVERNDELSSQFGQEVAFELVRAKAASVPVLPSL